IPLHLVVTQRPRCAHHANNRGPWFTRFFLARVVQSYMAANGIGPRKRLSRKFFINDGHGWFVRVIAIIERSATQQRNAKRFEITRASAEKCRRWHLFQRCYTAPFNLHRIQSIDFKRPRQRYTNSADLRLRLKVFHHLSAEASLVTCGWIGA